MTRKKKAEGSNKNPPKPKKGGHGKPKASKSAKKAKKKKRSLLVRLIRLALILFLWAAIIGAFILAWFAQDLPDIAKASRFEHRHSITVLASDGSVISRYGEKKGKAVMISDLPSDLIYAVLATEDRRFYSHPGIDIIGIFRAIAINISKGRLVQGGSTITQQLAKNLFLSHERTIKRKIQEAMLALWLEWHLSKDEILSAYLNRVYLGSGVYGVDAASKLYFGKKIQDINLREAAVLAGLLKAPSRYSPLSNPDLALDRSDVVLEAMVDAGYITKSDIEKTGRTLPKPLAARAKSKNIKYFSDWVLNGLDDLVGTPDMDLTIETTLDPKLQESAERALLKRLNSVGKSRNISQGAVLVMRPDGAVLAMIGGKNYSQSQFNRATQAFRPPGSAFKPIVYVTALEKGWRPDSKILDAPLTQGEYRPKNFAGKYFYGKVTLEEALAKSMNTATVRLMQEIGVASVIHTAKEMGIYSRLEPDLSLALGSSGVSMLEMATAYSTFANGGFSAFPYAITQIKNSDGRVIYNKKPNIRRRQVLSRSSVIDIGRMMQKVIDNGTGKQARLPFPASGKTGTSQDYRDAWFIGYTPEMVAAVWLGNDDNSPMKKVTGGSFPARIWRDVMLSGRNKYKPLNFSNMVKEKTGFSGLLGRILSENPSGYRKKDRPKNDYSHLNN